MSILNRDWIKRHHPEVQLNAIELARNALNVINNIERDERYMAVAYAKTVMDGSRFTISIPHREQYDGASSILIAYVGQRFRNKPVWIRYNGVNIMFQGDQPNEVVRLGKDVMMEFLREAT